MLPQWRMTGTLPVATRVRILLLQYYHNEGFVCSFYLVQLFPVKVSTRFARLRSPTRARLTDSPFPIRFPPATGFTPVAARSDSYQQE